MTDSSRTNTGDPPLTPEGFLRSLPKVDLHCHLTGTVAPETVLDLARKNGVTLRRSDPQDLFDVERQPTAIERERRFLQLLEEIAPVIVDRDDFARVAYELIERFAAPHNVRYTEIFVNPTAFEGVPYPVVVDGVIEGLAAAEETFGVRANVIPAILREQGPAMAESLVEQIVANPRDQVVGIAMDGLEELPNARPQYFAAAFGAAGKAGLRRTAHATLAPPEDLEACLDLLGCDRIDHGYRVPDSPELAKRIREDGVPITICETIPRIVFGATEGQWLTIATHPARRMIDAGLPVTIGTDDPSVIATNASQEYEALLGGTLFDADQASEVALAGVAATWLEPADRDALAASFAETIEQLRSRLEPAKPVS